MKFENKVLTENFFKKLEALIESNYVLDKFDNIVLKIPKKDLRVQCNDLINEFADEIGESEEEIKEFLLNMVNNLINDKGAQNVFYDEHKLVKELLTQNNKEKNNNENKKIDTERDIR